MAERVLVGITTYKDYEYLDMLLQSIRWYTYQEDEPFDLVVCDDGTPEGEVLDGIRATCARYGVTLIRHERNQGIPAGWNHLTMALGAESEIVVLLNNDLLVPPNWLRVATHFLDANMDNPHVGSCYWNPINRVPKDVMRGWLPKMGIQTFEIKDLLTGRPVDFFGDEHHKVRQGDGHGLGRVMCPCGCCFAFRREVFNQVGPFNEAMTSFHEESDWGTKCLLHGRASFGFPYPRPIHTHGYTFHSNPELQGGKRMAESRVLYRKIWQVPDDIPVTGYFQHVYDRLMPKLPERISLKYLVPNYDKPPQEWTLAGGEKVLQPFLEEREGEF